MNTTEIITFVGLAGLIILTQVGSHPLTLRRFLIPLLAVGFVAYHYLHTVPTAGGSLNFELVLSLVGIVCGILAATLMRVERDAESGRTVTRAGVAYASLWVIVFGGRLAFAWAAMHVWTHQVAQFSIQHEITSSAWTAAFILMALSMVVARTVVVAARALRLGGPASVPSAAGS